MPHSGGATFCPTSGEVELCKVTLAGHFVSKTGRQASAALLLGLFQDNMNRYAHLHVSSPDGPESERLRQSASSRCVARCAVA